MNKSGFTLFANGLKNNGMPYFKGDKWCE